MPVNANIVYRWTAAIPRGRVASYGQIAVLCGSPRAARLVGQLMANCPGNLPAHRVVRSDGRLAPEVVFGPGYQRGMLESEGVVFLPDGRVDMDRCQWEGPESTKDR